MSETPDKKNGKTNLALSEAEVTRALAEWPIAEKSTIEWDERADSIVARIEAGEIGRTKGDISDEALFAKPSGQEEEDRHNSPLKETARALEGSASESRSAVLGQKSDADAVEKKIAGELPMSMSSDRANERERDRASLKDLAKLASMTPAPPSIRPSTPASGVHVAAPSAGTGAATGDDSGLVDLKALSSPSISNVPPSSARMPVAPISAASLPPALSSKPGDMRSSAPPAPLASQGLFDDEPMAASEPPPSAQLRSSMPPALVASAVASTPPMRSIAPPPSERGRSGVVIAIAAVVAIGAVAAGGFLFLKSQKPPVATASQGATAPEAPAAKPDSNDVVAQADTPAANGANGDRTMDPSMLPEAAKGNTAAPKSFARYGSPAATPKPMGKASDAKGTTQSSPPSDLAAAMADNSMPPPPPAQMAPTPVATQAAQKPASDPTPGASAGLADAMRQAAGPTSASADDQKANAPQFAPGSVVQRPSQGAVTGALGAVLPEARACLGPDDPVSRATIVFGSAGNVQTVNVHGAAAGKPAEGCIKAALMKAKVPPFAESVYTATITVRH